MGAFGYDVPMVTQAANPICWVCCMSMVASWSEGYSIGVSKFAGGFDPSSASIKNPGANAADVQLKMELNGFISFKIEPKVAQLEAALKDSGPLILTHFCRGFYYGPNRKMNNNTTAAHAIVLTAIDTDAHTIWMNNPWGDTDVPITISSVIYAMKGWLATGGSPLASYNR